MLVFIEHRRLVPSALLRQAWDYVRHGHSASPILITTSAHFSPWHLPPSMSDFSHQVLFESYGEGKPSRAALSLFGCPLILMELAPSPAKCLAGFAEDPISHESYDTSDWPSPLPIVPSATSREAGEALALHLGKVQQVNAASREARALRELVETASRPLFDLLEDGDELSEELIGELVKRATALFIARQSGETVTLDDPALLQKFRATRREPRKK